MRLVNWRALVLAAAGFGLAACGDDVTVQQTPPTITLNPTAVTCTPGQQTAVGVSVSGGSNTSVTFTAGGSGITVTPNGSSGATVLCGSTPGSAVINVAVTSNGQTFNSAIPVTIQPSNTGASIVALSLSPAAASLTPGATATITPTVTLANGAAANTSTDVTYSSSSSSVTVARNSNNTATVTVAANATAGTQAVITATPNANTNLHAFTTITVVPTSSLVTGLSVSPTNTTLQVGGTQQIVGSVTLAPGAPANTPTTVTCTSSNTSVVTVPSTPGANCTITAVGNGTATITVASSAAPNVTQLVGVTVSSPAPVRLTIQGINVVGPAGTQIPADLTNVGGNLFLTMNLDPGDNRPDSVVVTIGGQRVNCQRFSVQLQQAYRTALLSGAADVQPITCQINTSQFNNTTGVPLVVNGQQALSATVFFHTGATGTGASTQQTATIQQNLTVNNQSGFFVAVTNTPSATQTANGSPASGQATGPQGVVWRAGTINVTVLPVNFAPGNQSGAGTPTFAATTVSLVDCGPGSTVSAAGVVTACAQRLVATRTTTQAASGLSGTASFTGDTGCFWDASFAAAVNNIATAGGTVPANGFASLGALFTNATTNVTSGCASQIASGVSTGFTGDPTTATLEGYTTPFAGRTVTGAGTTVASPAATYVVIGSTTASGGAFGGGTQAGNAILSANGQPLSPLNQPANTTTILGGNVADAIFIDNQAPEPVAQANFPTTNFSTSFDATQSATLVAGFFNANQTFTPAAFQFAFFDPATGLLVSTNPDWGGVDRVTDQFFAAPLSGASSNVTTGSPNSFVGSSAALNVTTTGARGLASLPNNNFFRLAVSETDALGNRRNSFVQQIANPGTAANLIIATRFNVDITPPTLTLVTSPSAAGAVRVGSTSVFGPAAVRTGFATASNIAPNPEIAFSFSDDIGFGPTPIQIQLARYRRSGGGSAIVECLSTVDAAGNATFVDISSGAAGSNGSACVPVLVSGVPIIVPTTSAVYVGTAQARDQAGNLSPAVSFSFVLDTTAPTNISVSLPQQLVGGSTVTFQAGANDNLAVAAGAPRITYPSLATPPANPAGNVLIYPQTQILNLATILAALNPSGTGSFSVLPQNQSSMNLVIPSFIRTITQAAPGTNAPGAYAAASALQAEIFDLANNSALSASIAIPTANIPNVPAASPYVNAANQVNNVNTFALSVGAGTGAQGTAATICGPVNVGTACPGTATFNVVQTGAAGSFLSQFVRLELWIFDPVANGWRQLATAPAGSVTDATTGVRTITSVVSLPANTQPFFLAPTATGAPISYNIIAIGVNSSGDALASQGVIVTINP